MSQVQMGLLPIGHLAPMLPRKYPYYFGPLAGDIG